MKREVVEGVGVLYEDEIARKDAAIAEQARQLQEALARRVDGAGCARRTEG